MKKITTILTLLVFTSIYSQIPSYVPINGLVGYYPFNGNPNDESGNGNNGSLGSGIILNQDRFGIFDKSYYFDGTGNITLTSLFTSGNQNFTISAWIKTNSTIGRKGIICWGQDTPNSSTYFFINSLGQLQFDLAYNGGTTSLNVINDNIWHYVAISNNGGLIQLFVDGLPTGNPVSMNPNINGGNKSIGSNIDNSGQNNFIGNIDDIGIWNRALTQEEITNLYLADTSCQSLVINTGILSFNPVTYNNTVTIYPNPANDHITIDCGNLANVTGYQIKIVNTLGQEVFSGAMNTQQYVVPLNTWGGTGVYFVKIYDASNNLLNTKKIILQ